LKFKFLKNSEITEIFLIRPSRYCYITAIKFRWTCGIFIEINRNNDC